LGGHREIIQLLLDKGADVNAQGGEYGNALQAASWGGHQEAVRLLLDNGADVNAQGGKSRLPRWEGIKRLSNCQFCQQGETDSLG
jgi:ankyrin repeat protein